MCRSSSNYIYPPPHYPHAPSVLSREHFYPPPRVLALYILLSGRRLAVRHALLYHLGTTVDGLTSVSTERTVEHTKC